MQGTEAAMRYMTESEIDAFGPDPMPADVAPLEEARRAMRRVGCWADNQQMGSRWPARSKSGPIRPRRWRRSGTVSSVPKDVHAGDLSISERAEMESMIGQRGAAATRAAAATLLCATCALATAAGSQQRDPYRPWARVLEKFVDERGEVDFRALARSRADLDAFLDYVAWASPRSTPESFPIREAQLAYYVNAYNALSMFNVIDSGFPKSLAGLTKLWFFGFKRFTIGGERVSLYALENDVIRPLGDERVHFALNCMSVGCPRLPREPFRPDKLQQQLDEAAIQFFGEARNLRMLPERKLVRVSSILKFYAEDFLAKSPTLIAYVNKYASPKVPDDYGIEFVDYDWTVNDRSVSGVDKALNHQRTNEDQ